MGMIAHASPTSASRRPSIAVALQPASALAVLVAVGFGVRVAIVFGRELQRYLPDEYLYGQLARSIAQGHGLRVLGESVALPTLLQPVLTAPFWLGGDPELAFRLTQCANAAAMSLGAVVVYLLARELRVPAWSAVGAAALALASPDLLYAGYVTADAFGYLLALLAVLLAVRTLARPSFPLQASFLAIAGLATLTRAQYASLFIAAAAAAVAVERGRLRALVTRHGLLVATPLLAATAVVGTGRLGRYATLTSFHADPGMLRWLPASAFIVALAAGAVIVPGAVAWSTHELARPQSRIPTAFAAVAVVLVGTLLIASSLIASETTSERFFERYLIIVPPLAAVAFCCWIAESRPWRYAALGMAAALVIAVARVPLSEFAAGQGRADSPLLLAVGQLEAMVGVGNASLLTALAATVCVGLAAAAAYGRIGGRELVVATGGVLALMSLGAHTADRSLSHAVREARLGPIPGWVDQAGPTDVLLVQTARGDQAAAMLLSLQNTSVTGAALLGTEARPFDGATRRLTLETNGKLRLGGRPIRRPLALVETATRVVMSDAAVTARVLDVTLVEPRHDATVAAVVDGIYRDGWLAGSGSVTVYATGDTTTCRRTTVELDLPVGAPATRLTWKQGARARTIVVRAGRTTAFSLQANGSARSARFGSPDARTVADPNLRSLSVHARVTTVTRPCSSA